MTSEKWTAADLPNLTGRTVVITGASSGLGVVASRELARVGARVVLAVRDVAKGQKVAASISGNTEVRQLDLASLASVRAFAQNWTGDLDILINNAGIMYPPNGRTADGFELNIGTNHLGHFALTLLLLPHIKERIVNVTSNLASSGKIDVEDLNWERRRNDSSQQYSDSKQANMLFTFELQRRLTQAGRAIRVISAHPGVAKTNLIAHAGGVTGTVSKLVVSIFAQDAEGGALPILFAATQDVPGNSFVGPDGFRNMKGYPALAKPSASTQDPELAKRLWDASARLTNTATSV